MIESAQGGDALALALAAMQAAPGDDAARLAFFGALADSELFLMLAAEPAPDGQLRPRIFDLEEGRVALAFDSEARLADFSGQAVDYAALPGRVLVSMMAGQGLSLLINPDSDSGGDSGSDQAAMLAPEALRWLAGALAAPAPAETSARAAGFGPPAIAASALARLRPALERRLSCVPGLRLAVLAGARWEGGGEGLVLALAGVPQPVRAPLARAMSEALVLSGLDEAALDVIFPTEAAMAPITEAGLTLTPATFQPPERPAPPRPGPGMDPTRPPRLR